MPRHQLTDEERRRGGRNGKRKPLHEVWGERITELKRGKKETTLDMAFRVVEEQIEKGNLWAVNILFDRIFGKAAQYIVQENVDPDKDPEKVKNSIADQIKALREPEKIIEVKPEPVKPKRKTAPKKKAAKKKTARKK